MTLFKERKSNPPPTNLKKGFNRIYVVVSLGWAVCA